MDFLVESSSGLPYNRSIPEENTEIKRFIFSLEVHMSIPDVKSSLFLFSIFDLQTRLVKKSSRTNLVFKTSIGDYIAVWLRSGRFSSQVSHEVIIIQFLA